VITPAHPQKGDVIAGKYVVEDVLGAGGMGVVVAARDTMLRRRVAVKFLLANATQLPDAVARFLREARAAVAIQSEHVARVIEVGTLENGAPYMVMEHLAGTDFAKLIKKKGPLPVEQAVDFVLQAGEAIAEAHALGIVHRDLKPGNLFLTTRTEGTPLVKVLDFGLSKMEAQEGDAPEASLTATGFVMGSPQYMSPEQVRSLKHIDWRTDIWALGVILYEVITGRRPFDGPSLTAVCVSIGADAPRPMRELRADVPEGLDTAVMACLEKDRTRRTRSVAELAQAIAPFASAQAQASVQRIMRLLPESETVPLPAPVPSMVTAPSIASVARATTAPVSQSAPVIRPTVPTGPAQLVVPSGAVVLAQPDAPTTAQGSAWGGTGPVPRRRPVGAIAAAVAAVMALIALLAWVRASPSREGAAAKAPPDGEGPSPSVVAEKPAAPVIVAGASASGSAPPAPATPAVAPPRPSPAPAATAAPQPAPKTSATATARSTPTPTPTPSAKLPKPGPSPRSGGNPWDRSD